MIGFCSCNEAQVCSNACGKFYRFSTVSLSLTTVKASGNRLFYGLALSMFPVGSLVSPEIHFYDMSLHVRSPQNAVWLSFESPLANRASR